MKFVKHISILIIISLLLPATLSAQTNDRGTLERRIKTIADSLKGRIGVSVMGLDFKASLVMNDNRHYPMQSTFKFPLAICILNKVDKGQLSLQRKVHIPKATLDTNTWSPMVKDFPNQDIDMTIQDLLVYSVSKSDNNACDILFAQAGGTKAVNNYIHSIGVKEISIAATEWEMKQAWPVQYTNWCKPGAVVQLLKLFYEGKLLKKASNDLLMNIMVKSENPATRLKGLLPPDAIVAHKTGTSNTNEKGMKAATNDVGIITLPNGKHYAIAVFVSDYFGGIDKGERVIAEISKAVWDYYSGK